MCLVLSCGPLQLRASVSSFSVRSWFAVWCCIGSQSSFHLSRVHTVGAFLLRFVLLECWLSSLRCVLSLDRLIIWNVICMLFVQKEVAIARSDKVYLPYLGGTGPPLSSWKDRRYLRHFGTSFCALTLQNTCALTTAARAHSICGGKFWRCSPSWYVSLV